MKPIDILFLSGLVFGVVCVRRHRFAVPVYLSCLILAQMLTYSVVYYFGDQFPGLAANWHVHRYFVHGQEALWVYFSFLAICLLLSLSKMESVVGAALDYGGQNRIRDQVNTILVKYSKISVWFIFIHGISHCIVVDLSFISANIPYTWLRSPSVLGFEGGLGVIHTVAKFIPTFSVLIYFVARDTLGAFYKGLLILSAVYSETLLMVTLSKWAVMPFATATFMLFLSKKRIPGMIMGFVFGYMMLLMLGARSSGMAGYGQLVSAVQTQSHLSIEVLISALINLFNGVFNYAAVLELPPFVYSIKFQILSLSPLPSWLDGYQDVVIEGGKIVIFKPVAGLSQLNYFHPVLQVAFWVQALLLIYKVESLKIISRQSFIVASVLLVVGFMAINVYYLRTAIRFFYLAWLVVALTSWLSKLEKHRLRNAS